MSNIGYLVIDGIINPITNILSHTQSNLIPNSDTQLYFLAILPSNKSVKANIINSIIANLILFDNRVGIIIIGDIPLVSVNKFGICFFILFSRNTRYFPQSVFEKGFLQDVHHIYWRFSATL